MDSLKKLQEDPDSSAGHAGHAVPDMVLLQSERLYAACSAGRHCIFQPAASTAATDQSWLCLPMCFVLRLEAVPTMADLAGQGSTTC